MMSVALYARVSSSQQVREATVASQVEALRERARRDGLKFLPSDIYVDEGFSGATLARPALERLRDRAAEGGLDRLYVHAPDRLARRYAYQVLLVEELSHQGVEIVFEKESVGDGPEAALLIQIQGVIAEYERARIQERSRRGKLHKARSGAVSVLAGAPYGYRYVRRQPEEPARYEILLPEAGVVRSMFSWLVEEQLSTRQIIKRLSEQSIPTRTGRPVWSAGTVRGILRNPAYKGQAAFGKKESVERRPPLRQVRGRPVVPRRAKSSYRPKPQEQWLFVPVPALISEEQFEAAQEQLARNARHAKRNRREGRFLLSGLVVCSKCGYGLYGRSAGKSRPSGGRHVYYQCNGRDKHRFGGTAICDNPIMRADLLDAHVWREVRETLEDPERVAKEWTRRSQDAKPASAAEEQRTAARQQLDRLERTDKRLLDAYEADAISLEELKERRARVNERRRDADRGLRAAEEQLQRSLELRDMETRLEHFSARVRENLDNLDAAEQQRIVRTLVARVEVDESRVTVVFRVPAPPTAPPPNSDKAEDSERASTESCRLRTRVFRPACVGSRVFRPASAGPEVPAAQ